MIVRQISRPADERYKSLVVVSLHCTCCMAYNILAGHCVDPTETQDFEWRHLLCEPGEYDVVTGVRVD